MLARVDIEASYDHLVSQELVQEVVRLLRADRPGTSLVLSLEIESGPSLMDLEGLGREIWAGEDAQDYVSRLRSEWSR